MKLSPIKIKPNLYHKISTISFSQAAPKHDKIVDTKNMQYYKEIDNANENSYFKAKKYLEYKKSNLSKPHKENISIKYFDLDRLNGIQKGIEVFEGLSFKQISFILDRLSEIAMFRGCYNNCAHCYAEAKHPIKETDDFISKIDWEDFTNLTNGIKELNNRLGFNIFREQKDGTRYLTAFHDADCSQIEIKDKDGIVHDWYEIAKHLYKATKKVQLFDTAGWYIQDKKAQQRMESYVQKLLADDEIKIDLNISANPYHAMHYRAVEHMKNGNKEKEEYFRQKDSERMANVLFTLTPLLKKQHSNIELSILARAMSNKSNNSKGLSEKDLKKTFDRHFEELKKLYKKDFETNQKVIKNKKEIQRNIYEYKKEFDNIGTTPAVTNKLKDLYTIEDRARAISDAHVLQDPEMITKKEDSDYYRTIIDANGKVYLSNFYETYETDMQLNFKNKNQKTATIAPNLCYKQFKSHLIDELMGQKKNIVNIS